MFIFSSVMLTMQILFSRYFSRSRVLKVSSQYFFCELSVDMIDKLGIEHNLLLDSHFLFAISLKFAFFRILSNVILTFLSLSLLVLLLMAVSILVKPEFISSPRDLTLTRLDLKLARTFWNLSLTFLINLFILLCCFRG